MDQIHIGPGHLDKLNGIGQGVSTFDMLRGADGQLDECILPYGLPYPRQHLQRESAAVAQGPAVLVLPGVCPRRKKLVKQPAVSSLNGDDVYPGQLGHGRSLGIAVQCVSHELAVHAFNRLPILPQIVHRADGAWPCNILRVGHAPGMVELHRNHCAVLMDCSHQLAQGGQGPWVVQYRMAIRCSGITAVYRGIPRRHQGGPSPGLFCKILYGIVGIVPHSIQVTGLDWGGKYPVAKAHMPDLKRLKESGIPHMIHLLPQRYHTIFVLSWPTGKNVKSCIKSDNI